MRKFNLLKIEGVMPKIRQANYPVVELVLDTVGGWFGKHSRTSRPAEDFDRCSVEELVAIAKDLGISACELRGLAAKGSGAADLVGTLLTELRVERTALDPSIMRDLQRLCIVCRQKSRCQRELTKGTVAEHFREFCPNAFTLSALLEGNGRH
jgi:hypothetical protein